MFIDELFPLTSALSLGAPILSEFVAAILVCLGLIWRALALGTLFPPHFRQLPAMVPETCDIVSMELLYLLLILLYCHCKNLAVELRCMYRILSCLSSLLRFTCSRPLFSFISLDTVSLFISIPSHPNLFPHSAASSFAQLSSQTLWPCF